MKKIQQKSKDIELKLLTSIMVFIIAVTPASAWICSEVLQYPVPTQLTDNEARDDYHSISADGSRIAFRSNVDGDNEIWVVNSDGTGLKQLTYNKRADGTPSISADGSTIAFQSNVDGDFEIFVMNSDGTGLTQLTHNEKQDMRPSISADGSMIAFRSNVDGDNEIWVVNSNGTGLKQLTHNEKQDMRPSISADGSRIAYRSVVGDHYEIIVMTDMCKETRFPDIAIRGVPKISADGKKISFKSNVDGDNEIFVIALTVQALIDVKPDTLNLDSKGRWITTYIEFPENYDVNDIDVNTVILHNQIQAEDNPTEIGDYDNDGIADIMLKFDRYAVQEILEEGDKVEINIKGELFDGTSFEGSDTIRIIDKGKGK